MLALAYILGKVGNSCTVLLGFHDMPTIFLEIGSYLTNREHRMLTVLIHDVYGKHEALKNSICKLIGSENNDDFQKFKCESTVTPSSLTLLIRRTEQIDSGIVLNR